MKKVLCLLCSCISLTLAVLFLTNGTFAWLSSLVKSEKRFGFISAGNRLPELSVISWDQASGTPAWQVHPVQGDADDSGFRIDEVVGADTLDENNQTVFRVQQDSLHLGVIENLVDLSNDNKIYLRFKFNKGVHGTQLLQMRVANDATETITLYHPDLTPIATEGDSELQAFLASAREKAPIQCRFAIVEGESAPATEDAAFAAMIFHEFTLQSAQGQTAELGATVDLTTVAAEEFCIYLEITPNTETFGDMAQYFNDYMPCVVLLGLVLELQIY